MTQRIVRAPEVDTRGEVANLFTEVFGRLDALKDNQELIDGKVRQLAAKPSRKTDDTKGAKNA